MRIPGSRRLADRSRDAAILPHAEQGAGQSRREDDHAIAIPRPSARRRSVAQGLCWASRHGEFLELALGEEPEVPAIRRPEWERRAVSAWDRPRVERIERPDPDPGRAAFIADEGKIAPVRREHQELQARLLWQRDGEATGELGRRRLAKMPHRGNRHRDDHHHRDAECGHPREPSAWR